MAANNAPLPVLDVVIVNWNAGRSLVECLCSLGDAARTRYRLGAVVVVDNASTDGSVEDLDPQGLPLRILRNSENRGFAAACNQGAATTRGDLLLFLNPDTAVTPAAIDLSVSFLSDPGHAEVGICGGLMVDTRGRPQFSCARFPTLSMFVTKALGLSSVLPGHVASQRMSEADLTTSRRVDQVIGAYYLVRRSLFDRLEGFDERFFVYYEEVDFSLRALQLGYTSYFLREAVVQHLEGVSSGQVRDRRLAYQFAARTEFAGRHWSPLRRNVLVGLTLAVELPVRVVRALFRADDMGVLDVLSAGALYLRYLASRGVDGGDALQTGRV